MGISVTQGQGTKPAKAHEGGVGRWRWFMCLWNPGMDNPRAGVCGTLSLG